MILDIDPKAKGLIFDLDGTIVDSMPIHYVAWRNTAAKYGIELPVELFQQLAGVPLYPTVEKLNEIFKKQIDPQEMGNTKELEYENSMHNASLIEPVFNIVKKYHGVLPMAVGTGGGEYIANKTMRLMGLDKYIDIVVSSDDITNGKPHPETFLRCAERMGIDPALCQVFEDGALGIQAGKAAGMMVVDVTNYYQVTTGE